MVRAATMAARLPFFFQSTFPVWRHRLKASKAEVIRLVATLYIDDFLTILTPFNGPALHEFL
jgi:hypothetical protein